MLMRAVDFVHSTHQHQQKTSLLRIESIGDEMCDRLNLSSNDLEFWSDDFGLPLSKRAWGFGIFDLFRPQGRSPEPKNNPKSKIQNPKSKIQNPKSKIDAVNLTQRNTAQIKCYKVSRFANRPHSFRFLYQSLTRFLTLNMRF
jgi:hypothetical protein